MVVVGGGIVGTATAMALAGDPHVRVVVLEAEDRLAAHQSGHNSGVIHSGLYYRPGSLKARNCVAGREALYRFCQQHGVRHERCGKLVVATRPEELPRLEALARRGHANGLRDLRSLSAEEVREREPNVAGLRGLLVPQTGIVDFAEVTRAFGAEVERAGGEIRTGVEVRSVHRESSELLLATTAGEIRCSYLVNCAGLGSDRLARACAVDPGVRIVPFRGEYYELVPQRADLVRHLVYQVPDPALPFLGVHFTRTVHGTLEAGPNAVLAFRRHGYERGSFSLRDTLDTLSWGGFWRMANRHWLTACREQWRSWSRRAFVRNLRRLVPGIRTQDVRRGITGVRAQALARSGELLDDFHIVEADRMLHVLNAPSPAATASISIGETLARMARIAMGAL